MKDIDFFLKDFSLLYKTDKYIPKKEVDSLFLKYENVIKNINNLEDGPLKEKAISLINNKDKIIELKNEKFVQKKLIEYKDYFDNMFKGIDDNIILDEEQRRAILIDEDYSLVIAGAGSGKTTTMAAKVKYLVDKLHVKEDKIILLAFTNKACSELQSRIQDDFKLDVEVLTFHKLGMKFLRQIISNPIQIVSDGTFNRIMEEFVTNYIFKSRNKLKEFIYAFSDYVSFDSEVFEYRSYGEYYDYYVRKIHDEHKKDFKEFCIENIRNRLGYHIGITGERFRSASETRIANYLFNNSIDYKYEKVYPHKLSEGRSYSPDFTINNNGKPVYIEFYGLSYYSSDGKFSVDEVNFYKKLITKKRELHEKYSTDLIELYSKYDFDTDYLKELSKSLDERFITKKKKTLDEIYNALMYSSKERVYFRVVKVFNDFISRFKERGNTLEDFEKYIQKTDDDIVKMQLKYLKEFYFYYEHKIHSDLKIDFQDMINYAYRYASDLKKKNIGYDYIIIDEYQDISYSRYNFAKRISDLFNSKIVAVGDDWQAIYSFSGSDVSLFTNFINLMGYAQITKIQKTYRNSQELLDVATDFISIDYTLFHKTLKSDKHLKKPVQIYYYDCENFNNKLECLINIIRQIYNNNNNNKILLLGRFNIEKNELTDTSHFTIGAKDRVICTDVPKAKIDFLTVHASKGLGYDQVIILNALNDKYGFPAQVKDPPVLKLLYDKSNVNINPEEMRLFYVALTRTKNRVYILCPYIPDDKRSIFVKRIEKHVNVKQNIGIGI